jgi:hypothetical protein
VLQFTERPRSPLIPEIINEGSGEAEESDPEEGFEFDRFRQYLRTGQEPYDQKKYQDAVIILQRAYEIAQSLPHKYKQIIDVKELRFKIGTCFFHQNLHVECKAELSSLIKTESTSNEHAR